MADSERTWATTFTDGRQQSGYRCSKSVTGGDGTVRYLETHFDKNKPGDLNANYTALISSRNGSVITEYDDRQTTTIKYPDGSRFEDSGGNKQWFNGFGEKIQVAKNLPANASYEDEMRAIQSEREERLQELVGRASALVNSREFMTPERFSQILSQRLEEVEALGGRSSVDKFIKEIATAANNNLQGEYFKDKHGLEKVQIKNVDGRVIASGNLLPAGAHKATEIKAGEFVPEKYMYRQMGERLDPYTEREVEAYKKEYNRRGLPKPVHF